MEFELIERPPARPVPARETVAERLGRPVRRGDARFRDCAMAIPEQDGPG
jgi:hypothetical protein